MQYGGQVNISAKLRAQDETAVHRAVPLQVWDKLARDIGFFERTPDMVFALEHKKAGCKIKQLPVIRYK